MGLLESIDLETRQLMAGEFSESMTLQHDGDETTFKGLFERTYLEVDDETGITIESKNSRILVSDSYIVELIGQELPRDNSRQWVIIARNRTYQIARLEPLEGVTAIVLRNA